MTIEKGRDLIDQMDIDMQVMAESSRNGGQRRSEGLRIRHCKTYGKTGHNARTCQKGIKATGNKYNN
jgi:hypothetical protein